MTFLQEKILLTLLTVWLSTYTSGKFQINMTFESRSPLQYADKEELKMMEKENHELDGYINLAPYLNKRRFKRSTGFQYKRYDTVNDNFRHTGRAVLRPEYGTLFEYQGMLLQNLQTRYMFIAIDLGTGT